MNASWQICLERPPQRQIAGQDLRGVDLAPDACWTENHFSIHWVLLYFHNPVEVVIDQYWLSVPRQSAVIVPPHAYLTLRFLQRSVHDWVHFSCSTGRGATETIAAVTELPRSGAWMRRHFEQVCRGTPAEAAAPLEAILRRLITQPKPPAPHATVSAPLAKAVRLIEHGLHKPLFAPELARVTGVSQRHLLSLFKDLTGTTIVGYIRRRRAERAYHLLTHTNRTIPSIAAECGLADLQLFNKTLRQFYGCGPRELRRRGREKTQHYTHRN